MESAAIRACATKALRSCPEVCFNIGVIARAGTRRCSQVAAQMRRIEDNRLSLYSNSQQTDDDRETASRSSSENQRSSPPPPPPPPPPPRAKTRRRFPLWGTILLLLLAAGLWWSYIDSQVPDVYKDKDGMQYMLTKGGNQVMVGEDTDGRVYFIDRGGNFYYDSGDANVGIYVVTADDKVFNLFDDGSGERQKVYVGTFQDLKTQRVTELGGVPVEKLRKALKGFDGTVTGFDIPARSEDAPNVKDFGGRPVPKAIMEYEPDIVLEQEDKE